MKLKYLSIFPLSLMLATLTCLAQSQGKPDSFPPARKRPENSISSTAGNIRITGDTLSLNFTLFKYFPFISATVNGRDGWLMFDTGAQSALELDNKLVSLGEGLNPSSGFVSSGQSYQTQHYPTVKSIALDNRLFYSDAGPVSGHDFSYMNSITPDIIGLIGYDFFKNYLFKLDYQKKRITFYRNTPKRQRRKDFLFREKLIATIDFELRKLPNHPVIPLIMGRDTLAISFDTGQLGTLTLTEETKAQWMSSGMLSSQPGKRQASLDSLTLPGHIRLRPGSLVLTPPSAAQNAKKAIGITEKNSITFGFALLSQYKSVWDFQKRKIYLMEK